MTTTPRAALALLACALPLWPALADERPAAAPSRLEVANVRDGEVVRHPVLLLRGTVAATTTSLRVINATSSRPTRVLEGVVAGGRFKALTELLPGRNELWLAAPGSGVRQLTVRYEPQTNARRVRVVYMTDDTGETTYQTPRADDPQDFRGKLDTAMKLLQCFTADRMHEQGLGWSTFRLELDDDGRVVVHTLRGDHPASHYWAMDAGAWWGHVHDWVRRALPGPGAKYVVIAAYTRWDPVAQVARGHTALGGGDLGLFGGGDLFAWPSSLGDVVRAFGDATRVDATKVFDDSAGRSTHWALASTTMGATLHELGHALGLPHSREPQDVMTRGFDHLGRAFLLTEAPARGAREPRPIAPEDEATWHPVSATLLRGSPWLALDEPPPPRHRAPEVRVEPVRDGARVVVEARAGIGGVVVIADGEARRFESFWARAERPTRWEASCVELAAGVGAPAFEVRAIDACGRAVSSPLLTTRSPEHFVRAWRPLGPAVTWTRRDRFEPFDVQSVQRKLLDAGVTAPGASPAARVDLKALFPSRTDDVVARVGRAVEVERPRRVRILAGSDDALRVWVNGALAIERLVLRGAAPDQDRATVALRQGVNTLVAEVSQGNGDWALYLRLEDESGAPLVISPRGRLQAP